MRVALELDKKRRDKAPGLHSRRGASASLQVCNRWPWPDATQLPRLQQDSGGGVRGRYSPQWNMSSPLPNLLGCSLWLYSGGYRKRLARRKARDAAYRCAGWRSRAGRQTLRNRPDTALTVGQELVNAGYPADWEERARSGRRAEAICGDSYEEHAAL